MKKTAAVVAVMVAVALAGFGAWYFTAAGKTYSGAPVPITLGGLVSDANIVIFVAEDRHFFEANGINFTFKIYDVGLSAINDLLHNKIDIAGAAEYPVARKAFEKAPISVVASTDKLYVIDLVGLTGRGIRNAADIKGKKIGLPRGAIEEFYLGRFLNLHGMSIRDVTLVNVLLGQELDAIARGSVDAVVTNDPYVSQILKQHPHEVVSWSVQSSQAVYSSLMCRKDRIRQHPDLVRRFLNALSQAEGYIEQHPAEAKALLRERYHYDDAYIARIWPGHQFALTLDQSLIIALEDEARWMIENNMTNEKQVPDFLNYVYEDGLKAIKPEAVNIIR
jgi:NitT/TauT family transport system substrate-binding protein